MAKLAVKDLVLDVPIFLASLSGYSDLPMRVISRNLGAPLTFAGVMLDSAINHPKVRRRMDVVPGENEHPVGGQIMGSDVDEMTRAALGLEEIGYDVVDLNFACPVPKVLRRDRGGNLMKNPDRVIEIFRSVRKVVTKPLMMKLRIGYGHGEGSREDFYKICDVVCNEGLDAITIHGRSVLQRYRGRADWDVLEEVKRKYPHMIIFGSGDLLDAQTIKKRLDETGIDGAAIARGAVGNPWIFRETRALLSGEPMPPSPSLQEIGQTLLDHFDMVGEFYFKKKGVAYFRKFSVGYCKRHPQRKKAQLALMAAQSPEEVYAVVREWFEL